MPKKAKALTHAAQLAAKLAEIDALLEQNDRETRDAQAAIASDPSDTSQLAKAADLAVERERLLAMRETLMKAAQQHADDESDDERRARVEQLVREVDDLLEKRAAIAREIVDVIDALAAALARYGLASEDLSNAVNALFKLTGRDPWHHRPPETQASATESVLLDALWRSGLGRTGPRLSGRVTVERGFGTRPLPPVGEAHDADAAKLRAAVEELARAALPQEREEAA